MVSILFFTFFLSYFFCLSTIKSESQAIKKVLSRNKIDVVILFSQYGIYFISLIINKHIFFNEILKSLFSILYFIILADLSFGFIKLFGGNKVIIFLCMLVPPLGIYYLQFLYNESLAENTRKSTP